MLTGTIAAGDDAKIQNVESTGAKGWTCHDMILIVSGNHSLGTVLGVIYDLSANTGIFNQNTNTSLASRDFGFPSRIDDRRKDFLIL